MKKDTSWDNVANWYDNLLSGEGTYQKELILPNLLRLMAIKRGEKVLDLACGQGFFTREFHQKGANVIGVDVAPKLIQIAKKNSSKDIQFRVGRADSLPFIKSGMIDTVVIVLALQNIENAPETLKECSRVLKKNGNIFIVLNHPAFRVPGASRWSFDEKEKTQYRRIDRYLSERKAKIEMHPGDEPGKHTLSFHRPLQFYFKAMHKAGFAVTGFEEWNSHKKSEPGPRAAAEDTARKEIPLFLAIVATKTV